MGSFGDAETGKETSLALFQAGPGELLHLPPCPCNRWKMAAGGCLTQHQGSTHDSTPILKMKTLRCSV